MICSRTYLVVGHAIGQGLGLSLVLVLVLVIVLVFFVVDIFSFLVDFFQLFGSGLGLHIFPIIGLSMVLLMSNNPIWPS